MYVFDIQIQEIERQVGDPWGRTPQYTTDTESNPAGILYVPDHRGSWNAKPFANAADAVAFLDRKFPHTLRDCNGNVVGSAACREE